MILMQLSIDKAILDKMSYLVGDSDIITGITSIPAKEPFDEGICEFLSSVSNNLMKDPRSRQYSDVITLGFWLRKASLKRLKNLYGFRDDNIHLGRGLVFHIAPSNVPVNFAYSLVSGMLMGNANIVRVPSKDFKQVNIISEAINKALDEHEAMKPYVVLVRYNRDKDINDALSSIADTRIVWGGDQTIAELRKSTLPPRSTEITFADRYSIAVIDADEYIDTESKTSVAQDFYNDTYFSDQNACTSPRIVIWMGKRKAEAKEIFWKELHKIVKKKYTLQDITTVNKLTSSYLAAVNEVGARIIKNDDNLITRVKVSSITDHLMDLKDNCGFFFEYDCDDVIELKPLVDDNRCQTVSILGDKEMVKPLLYAGVKGIDRISPIGHTMDFDLLWDGYDLSNELTRTVGMQ